MRELLVGMLPRFFPGLVHGEDFICVTHDGKSDLEKSIPRKLRGWNEPDVRFIIVRDNDGHPDCKAVKTRLLQLCPEEKRAVTLVRLVCQELESWYFGDTDALADAFKVEPLRSIVGEARYRATDDMQRPSEELRRLYPAFQKLKGARVMARYLERERNRSRSFQTFIRGVEALLPSSEDNRGGEG